MRTCSMDNQCPSQFKKSKISRLRRMLSNLARCPDKALKMTMPQLKSKGTSKTRLSGWKSSKISGTSTTRTTQVILIEKRWYLSHRLRWLKLASISSLTLLSSTLSSKRSILMEMEKSTRASSSVS